MDEASQRLVDAFTAALPGYLLDLIRSRGWDEEGVGPAADEAAQWLRAELTSLLERPYADQRRSPLEVAQESTRFVGEALADAGTSPPVRGEIETRALPGDLFDLAPASSAALGESAWEAHIAWGLAKAAAMKRVVRPVATYVGRNLMDRTRLASVAEASGYDLADWDREPSRVALALVDLTDPRADDAIRELAGLGVRVIAFGPHVDDIAMARAGSLGATEVVPRSRFYARLTDWFPSVV